MAEEQYSLIVNGQFKPWPVVDYFTKPTTIDLNWGLDTVCFIADVVTFTVNDLLDGKVIDHVILDRQNRVVICNIPINPKIRKLTINIVWDMIHKQIVEKLQLTAGGGLIPLDQNLSFKLSGKELQSPINCYIDSNDYEIKKATLKGDKFEVVVSCKENKEEKVETTMPKGETRMKPQKIFAFVLVGCLILLFGGVIGWVVHQQLGDKLIVPVETVIAKPEVKIVESSLPKIQTETSNQDTYEMYKSMLQNPDLTFNEVDEMAAWVENINHDSSAKVIFDQDVEFVPTVSGYKEFVAHIRAGKLKEAKGVVQRKILSDVHLWQFRSCYKGWKDSEGEHSYTKEDRGLAEWEFSSNYSSYTSFRDLDNVHFGKREWIESIREVRKNHDLSEERNNLH